jgi:hypothetical protein
MITQVAARSYVRIKRENLNDAKPVLDLLLFGAISIIDGATSALSLDNEGCTDLKVCFVGGVTG